LGYFSGIRVFFLPTCEEHLTHGSVIPGTGEEYPEGRGHIGDEYVQYRRGHSRERRDKIIRDYTPFHIYLDTEAEAEERDRINSETEAELEGDMGDREDFPEGRGKGTKIPEGRGKGPKIPYDSTQAMLNDLTKGQRDMMNAITQMAISSQMIQHSLGMIGANLAGGVSGSSGNQAGLSGHQSLTRTYTLARRIARPLYP
jgi:hypothetical protein